VCSREPVCCFCVHQIDMQIRHSLQTCPMQLIKKWMLQLCIMFSLSSTATPVCSVHAINNCCNEQYSKPHPDPELCAAAFFGDMEKRQPSQDLTGVYHQVAVAGLQFLALALTYLARTDVAMPAPQPAPPVKGSLDSHAPQPATSATGRAAHHATACVAVTTVTVLPCILRFAGISTKTLCSKTFCLACLCAAPCSEWSCSKSLMHWAALNSNQQKHSTVLEGRGSTRCFHSICLSSSV